MLELTRAELKKDFPKLITLIQKHHNTKDDDRVEKELFRTYKPVRGLQTTRCYFMQANNAGPLSYISYDMEYLVLNPQTHLCGRTVQQVTVYENFIEWEAARQRQMSANADQTGLNFN